MGEAEERDHLPQDRLAEEGSGERIVIPLVEEELVAGTRAVNTGGVRVQKHVDTRIRKIEVPLLHDEVEVRRVAVNRVVNEIPGPVKKGDVLIIPVVEEELIVTKRLVVREEIHVMKKRFKQRTVKQVELERERAEVQRLDAQGRVISRRSDPAPPRTGSRRRGVID